MSIVKVIQVKPLDDYKLFVKFCDRIEGVADLKPLVGNGIFAAWVNKSFFDHVFIDEKLGRIAWSDELDICADSLHDEFSNSINASN